MRKSLLLLLAVILVSGSNRSQESAAMEIPRGRLSAAGDYLFMQPIQEAILHGRFTALQPICRERLTVNLEEPFALAGYLVKEQFIAELSARLARWQCEKMEWSSLQVEENIAVQSLNVIMADRLSGQKAYYKLILFMNKENEWKLYYLRGLKI